MWLQFPKVPYRRLSATIGWFRLHQFCRRFLKGWSLCVLVVFWRDLGSCLLTKYSYRKRLGTCDALLDIVCAGQLELDRGGELALVQIDFSAAFDRVNHGGLVFKLREAGIGGLILKVFQNFLSSRTQRVKVDGVFSSNIDVVSGVPQGSVLGPCSRFGMLVNPSKTRGMLISRSRTVEPLFPDLLIDGSVVEMVSELKIFWCHYWLQVVIWEASQSNCCLCLDEGWHHEEDNECFSRCHCSCQMLLGIYTPCARVLFSCLDVCSHFSPVVAWSCCQPGWPIKRWKCQLRSLAQAQSGISECLLQDWQSGWSPCAWSFSSAVCVEETNPWSLGCSLSIFRDT